MFILCQLSNPLHDRTSIPGDYDDSLVWIRENILKRDHLGRCCVRPCSVVWSFRFGTLRVYGSSYSFGKGSTIGCERVCGLSFRVCRVYRDSVRISPLMLDFRAASPS